MAGTLLHITLAERALECASIPVSVKREIWNSLWDFRLGAVLFDLPYYEHLLLQAIFRAARRDYSFNEWGEMLHARAPSDLCRRLLDFTSSPTSLAVALGALTHAAVDVVFHPEIERRVSQLPKGRVRPNRTHSEIETAMDICVHNNLLGHRGIGTPYTLEGLLMFPDASWAPLFFEAILAVHKEAPAPRRMNGWLRGLRLFALSHASARFFGVSSFSPPDPERDRAALYLAEKAIERAAQYLEAGFAYHEGSLSTEQFRRIIPNLNLCSGGNCTSSEFGTTKMQGPKNQTN